MEKEGGIGLFGSGLLTDLYEITMSAVYNEDLKDSKAVFELWVRGLPKNRGYLIASGLESALEYLKDFHYTREEIEYLQDQKVFSHVEEDFFEMLSKISFTGDVWAMPEGTVFFPEEPIIRIKAPIVEAQLVETAVLSLISYSTVVATKASRIFLTANSDGRKRDIVEFGARRAPGPSASVIASRASYIGGCTGTSNVYAGKLYNIPVFGTMAHSFVLAHDDELLAFKGYYKNYPESTVLLIDTYDTVSAAKKVSMVGKNIAAVRLDSGNVLALSKKVRLILDSQGLVGTGIFVSGDLDEYIISGLVKKGAPIDGFGVGTRLVTSEDAPYLGSIYKLVEIEKQGKSRAVSKFSEKKITYPGSKQVMRFEKDGKYKGDLISCDDEDLPENGSPLIKKVMEKGRLTQGHPELDEIRSYVKDQLGRLPKEVLDLRNPAEYKVRFSDKITRLLKDLKKERTKNEAGH